MWDGLSDSGFPVEVRPNLDSLHVILGAYCAVVCKTLEAATMMLTPPGTARKENTRNTQSCGHHHSPFKRSHANRGAARESAEGWSRLSEAPGKTQVAMAFFLASLPPLEICRLLGAAGSIPEHTPCRSGQLFVEKGAFYTKTYQKYKKKQAQKHTRNTKPKLVWGTQAPVP